MRSLAPVSERANHSRADPADEARLVELAGGLADAIEAAVGPWIERSVVALVVAWRGAAGPEERSQAGAAGQAAAAAVGPQVRALLATDIDDQRATPLTLLRDAVTHATVVLEQLGVPPVERDRFDEERFPHDHYGLAPATWSDIDPALHEPGMAWSAAKAFVHKARRR